MSVLMFHLSVLLMWVPRNLNESVIIMGSLETGVLGRPGPEIFKEFL